MKSHLKQMLVALMICSLSAATAFAGKVRKVNLTFGSDVMVDGTKLKAGAYDFKFNEETGELLILKEGKLKAKTTARLESRANKAKITGILTRQVGDVREFVGLSFSGSTQDVVVTPRGGATTVG